MLAAPLTTSLPAVPRFKVPALWLKLPLILTIVDRVMFAPVLAMVRALAAIPTAKMLSLSSRAPDAKVKLPPALRVPWLTPLEPVKVPTVPLLPPMIVPTRPLILPLIKPLLTSVPKVPERAFCPDRVPILLTREMTALF